MTDKKVCLITGCSRGIGQDTAIRLARSGWTVVGTLRSDAGREELERAGVDIVTMDVTKDSEVRQAVATVLERHGHIDAFVANAGRGLFGCFETLSEADTRQLMEVNFFGVLSCTRAVLPALRASQGRLIVVSSIAGRRSAPGSSLYNASKFAVEGWAEALSYELQPFGVEVVLIEPGPTESGFFDVKWSGGREMEVYGPMNERLAELQSGVKDKAVPVEVVSGAIERALEARRPAFRIPTGAQTKAQLWAKSSLPERWWRGLVNKAVSFPKPD